MSQIYILVADNHKDFLNSFSELLEAAGYCVFKAANPVEATIILQSKPIHLAVIDMRLTNDSDENDNSGLMLAKNVERGIPKVILTRYPTVEAARIALRSDSYGLPPAVDFVNKLEKNLINDIQVSLFKYVNLENRGKELEKLRNWMGKKFNKQELRGLCFELDVDYDDLEGSTKDTKIMALIGHFKRRDHIPVLKEACRKRRPGNWEKL